MWGIEFYNEAENKRKSSKSFTELSPLKEVEPIKSDVTTPKPLPDIPEESNSKENVENDSQKTKSDDDKTDPVPTPDREEDEEVPRRAPKLSQLSQDSSNLDEEYVIIENEKRKESRIKDVDIIKPGKCFFVISA